MALYCIWMKLSPSSNQLGQLPSVSLTSSGYELDLSSTAFGNLTESKVSEGWDMLRNRLLTDAYLYVSAGLDRDEVIQVRREITTRLAQQEMLDPRSEPMAAVAKEGIASRYRPDLAESNEPL